MNPNGREPTFGERAVGLSFNPSRDPAVDEIKALFARIIDMCHERRTGIGIQAERARLFSIAITEAQSAQMWAVKAQTWRD